MPINDTNKSIRTYVTVILAVCLFVYSVYQARNLITGPELSINFPAEGFHTSEALVAVEGKARNVSFISLNGKQIFVDDRGIFKEKLVAAPGYNIITVVSRDRFGRMKEETVHYYRERPAYSTAYSSEDKAGIQEGVASSTPEEVGASQT